MSSHRERKLDLWDSGRDAAGDALERIFEHAERAGEAAVAEDAGCDSFLERFRPTRPGDRAGGSTPAGTSRERARAGACVTPRGVRS